MDSRGSVTQWIDELKDDDPDAPTKIWRRYGADLLRLARSRLGTNRKRVSDEEDVALAAFEAFCRGVQDGRFAKLENRGDLWHLLVLLTVRKSIDQVRRETRRGERGESLFIHGNQSGSSEMGIERVAGRQSSPEVAAQSMEQVERLLATLADETLEQIAQWKLLGFTNDEIAEKLGCVTRTVERKLGLIRRKWEGAATA